MNSHEMKFLALGIFLVITLLFRILPALFRWIHTGIKGYNTSQLAQQKQTLGIKLLVLLGGVASLWVLIMGIAYGTMGVVDGALDSVAGGLSLLAIATAGGYLTRGLWLMKRLIGQIILGLLSICLLGSLVFLVFILLVDPDERFIILIGICDLIAIPIFYCLIKNLPRMH